MLGRGSNLITRKSRYEMGLVPPNEASGGQITFGSLAIVHHADHYEVYQIDDMDLDFTTQVKRSDEHIS